MAESAPKIRRCPRCKNPVESESQGCPSCGYLSPVARQQSPTAVTAVSPLRRKIPHTVAALRAFGIINLLLCGFLVAAFISNASKEADTAVQLLTVAVIAAIGMLMFAVAHIVETLVNIENKLSP